jgi:hypothetical protein
LISYLEPTDQISREKADQSLYILRRSQGQKEMTMQANRIGIAREAQAALSELGSEEEEGYEERPQKHP